MITLMSASAARKESELNMKFAAAKQLEEIENMINKAVHEGEFYIEITKRLYADNRELLEKCGYKVKFEYNDYSDDNKYFTWTISW